MRNECLRLAIALVAMVAVGCEKPVFPEEEQEETSGEVTKGNLRVSVLRVEQMPFEGLSQGEGASFSRLNCAVYRSSGTRVKQVNQKVGEAHFGTCYFQLDEGVYQLVVVGHSSQGNPTMTDLSSIRFTNKQGFTDTFCYWGTMAIGAADTVMEVSLSRIVALCRLVITDDFPAKVATLHCYYTGGSGAFDAKTGLGSVQSRQEVVFDVTGAQHQFDLYTFLHSMASDIHLVVTAQDANGQALYQRTFDVPMRRNQVTRLSGAFFSASEGSDVQVTVNGTWDGMVEVGF